MVAIVGGSILVRCMVGFDSSARLHPDLGLRVLQSWRGLSCVTCVIEPQMVTTVGGSALVSCVVELDLWGTYET